MNTNTATQEFTNSVAGLLTNSIFPAISKGLKDTKGVDVTLEELYKWCGAPMARSLIPAMGVFGGAVPAPIATTSTVGAKKKPGTKATVVEPKLKSDGSPETATGKPYVEGKSCRHFYEKGAVNAGKICGRDVVKGTSFCSTHKNKEGKPQKVNPGVAPSIETVEEEENDEGGLSVAPYDKERGLFREVNHEFIVRQEGELVISMGKLYPDNTIKPLNENEKIIARSLGITVSDIEDDPTPQMPVPRMPVNVPQMPINVPQMPINVPQMPINVPQMPVNVPQMPVNVPQMPINVPQMPINVPQMPMSVPQMPMSVPQMPRSVPLFPGNK
jgi:hypothetical protein